MAKWIWFAMLAAGAVAHANGRPPASVDLHFRAYASPTVDAKPQDVLAGMTWGLALSHDGGATWHWMCENAIGYGGVYDPDYEWLPNGAIVATTFDGVHVNRDGCTFETTSLGRTFVSQIALASDGTLYAAASDAADSGIYASTDGAHTFTLLSAPAAAGTWWQTLAVAPSQPKRLYVAGYIVIERDPNRVQLGSNSPDKNDGKELLLYRSDDGGATFSKLSTKAFTYSQYSKLEIAAVSPTNPDLVFARVTGEHNGAGDRIYRSDDAGGTWTRVLYSPDSLPSFVARQDGTFVAATGIDATLYRSTDAGKTYQQLPIDQPLPCFAEDPHGTLWACAQNYAHGEAILKTDDLTTWTPIMRFQDVAGPVQCPAGTAQHDACAVNWCTVSAQLGIPTPGCITAFGEMPPAHPAKPPPAGCCEAGSGATPALPALFVAIALGWRRRRARD